VRFGRRRPRYATDFPDRCPPHTSWRSRALNERSFLFILRTGRAESAVLSRLCVAFRHTFDSAANRGIRHGLKNLEERTLVQNRFLGSLSADLRSLVGRYLERVSYSFRHRLYGPDEPPRAAYFPVTGVISVVVTMTDGKTVEAITVGHESIAASECRFPSPSTGMRTAFAQVVGEGYKCDAADFRTLVDRNAELRALLDRHAAATVNVLAQTAACNRLHPVEERCARWLLLTAEGAQMNEFDLIHEFLAEMLGIKRSSVSPAAAGLQERGLIEYTRGRMRILDRDGLRDASCECYRAITREYDALYERSNKR